MDASYSVVISVSQDLFAVDAMISLENWVIGCELKRCRIMTAESFTEDIQVPPQYPAV